MSKRKVNENAEEDYLKYSLYFKSFSDETFENYKASGFYDCYVRTLFFKNWKSGFNSIGFNCLDEIYEELHQDVNSSYYLSSIGLYRTSNMHIRSMIELALQGIYFYEHPVELQKWRLGKFIIKHDKLKDYLKEHPRFIEKAVNSEVSLLVEQISKEWKSYSKHIHAESLDYFQTQKKSEVNKEFVKSEFSKWKTNYLKTLDKINKLYILFYKDEFRRFPSNNKSLLKLELSDN
ncbi:hypothetical protein ACQKE0_04280 [Shewanella colwelliana]|uniref:hypothetical protein n=1 Tax=Shewanella colwelliana TaxID=23 RepID=UPI003CFC07AC